MPNPDARELDRDVRRHVESNGLSRVCEEYEPLIDERVLDDDAVGCDSIERCADGARVRVPWLRTMPPGCVQLGSDTDDDGDQEGRSGDGECDQLARRDDPRNVDPRSLRCFPSRDNACDREVLDAVEEHRYASECDGDEPTETIRDPSGVNPAL